MTGFWWLLLGLLAGWLIELAIDFGWWRKRHLALQAEVEEQRAGLTREREAVASREAQVRQREQELGERETVLNGRDADVMAQAQRIDERSEAITRAEQRLDSRRADLERQAATLSERERDIGHRHQALRDGEAKFTERSDRLAAAESDADKRAAVLASRESALKKWEQRVLAKEKDLNAREVVAARLARDAERWRRHFHGMRALIEERYVTQDGSDDLKAIHGVGRTAEKLLRSLGIDTFAGLAEAPLGELSRLAERGGPELALSDPMSWAEQAQLIVDRDYIGFENLKAKLRGDIPPDGAPRDEVLEARTADADEPPRPSTGPGAAAVSATAVAVATVATVADGGPDHVATVPAATMPLDQPDGLAAGADPVDGDRRGSDSPDPGAAAVEATTVVDGHAPPPTDADPRDDASVAATDPVPASEPVAADDLPADPLASSDLADAGEADEDLADDLGEGLTDDAAEGVSRAALEAATREVGAREGGLVGETSVGRREIETPRDDGGAEAAVVQADGDGAHAGDRRQERFAFGSPTPSRGGGRRRRR